MILSFSYCCTVIPCLRLQGLHAQLSTTCFPYWENNGSRSIVNELRVQGGWIAPFFMPTSTLPYEVDFAFTNDTNTPASLQPIGAGGNGATLSLQKGECAVMFLHAGERYTYAVQSGSKSAQITCVDFLASITVFIYLPLQNMYLA